jgi:hypothetical protein
MEEVKIKSIELQIGDTKAKITIEQAQKLKECLNDLFGSKVIIKEEHHHHDHYPWVYQPVQRWITWQGGTSEYKNPNYIMYCSSNGTLNAKI